MNRNSSCNKLNKICHLNANQFSRMYNCPTELEEYSALLPRVYKSSMEPLSITQKQPPEVYNSLFNKDADLKTGNFVKRRLQYRCFPVKFSKFLKTPILKNICERLLLITPNQRQAETFSCIGTTNYLQMSIYSGFH